MTTRGKDGCRLLLEQLVGTGTVVTTDGRTCYDVVDKYYGAKFHGLNSMPAILKYQVETEPRPTPVGLLQPRFHGDGCAGHGDNLNLWVGLIF